jgi:hypothetical protein
MATISSFPMQKQRQSRRLVSLIVMMAMLASPLLAQRRIAAPKRVQPDEVVQPAPTFDTLLAADSFKVYCEVRGVGGLIHSPGVNDLLEPFSKLVGPDPEFEGAVKWLKAHAEILAGSRLLIAGWPSRPKLPNLLVAIEFSSAEEAKKFYPQLRGFLPTLMPTPTPVASPLPPPTVVGGPPGQTPPALPEKPGTVRGDVVAASVPPYQMQQAGTLILISDTAFTLRNLRPPNSKLLEEDLSFSMARNRFASEAVFVYVDFKSIETEAKEQRKRWEEEEQKRIEQEAASPQPSEIESMEQPAPGASEQPTPFSDSVPTNPTIASVTSEPPVSSGTLSAEAAPETDVATPLMFALSRSMFSGPAKWPEALGAALMFEDDAYVLRTLIINSEENKTIALPFVPQLLSGPALAPESPNIFPADTDFFVTASLDYPKIYEGMLLAMTNAEQQIPERFRHQAGNVPPPTSPFADYEAKLGIKIKDEILPLLGNEMAFALPRKTPPTANGNEADKSNAPDSSPKNARAGETNPIIAIAIKDREAVARLLPKIVESFGFKGASLLAQTEKRDSTEITSYGDIFAYAFVGDFLVLAPNAALTRHVVDSYLAHQTLATDSRFRNFTRWQPRQVLGQVYVAPNLVEQYSSLMLVGRRDEISDAALRLNPSVDPLTYSLTNEGQGPLHELHVPKNLLQLLLLNTSRASEQTLLQRNEAVARSALQSVFSAEATFQVDKGVGRYGTLDELTESGFVSKDMLQKYGYTIEVSVSGNKFEAIATPVEYGKTGRLSFFIDESGVLRAGDHGGGAATVADQPE